jgi:hypothetical protein
MHLLYLFSVLQMFVFSEDDYFDDANGVMVYRSLWYLVG